MTDTFTFEEATDFLLEQFASVINNSNLVYLGELDDKDEPGIYFDNDCPEDQSRITFLEKNHKRGVEYDNGTFFFQGDDGSTYRVRGLQTTKMKIV